jgi:hypothetical protein
MTALFWFNCLAAVGAGVAAFTVYKKRHLTELSTWLVFFLFATSLPWLGEFIVLGLFDSYAYKPGVFESPWAENIVGHLILNSTLWPGTAVLVAGYRLGYGWIALLSAVFLLFEFLFLRAGLYEHHWWQYYMTAAAIFGFLAITKTWFPLMDEKRHGLTRFITLFLAAVVIIHLPTSLMLLYGKQYYLAAFAQDAYRSSTIFILFYQMAEALAVMAFFFWGKWYWTLAAFAASLGGQAFLAGKNILVIGEGWSLAYSLLLYAAALTLCFLMERYTLRPKGTGKRKTPRV